MRKLIDADKVLNDMMRLKLDKEYSDVDEAYDYGIDDCIVEVSDAELVDAEPVVHAHWSGGEIKNGVYKGHIVLCDRNGYVYVADEPCECSNCGSTLLGSDEYEVKGRYCPNCGAKMDEETDE